MYVDHDEENTSSLETILYCSQLWRPQLIKDINMLERMQRREMKNVVLNDYTSSYKSRLQQLQMLPLMYIYINLMT